MVGLCHGANSRTSLGCSPKVAMVRSDRSDEFDGLIITGKHLFPGGGDRFGRIGFADSQSRISDWSPTSSVVLETTHLFMAASIVRIARVFPCIG